MIYACIISEVNIGYSSQLHRILRSSCFLFCKSTSLSVYRSCFRFCHFCWLKCVLQKCVLLRVLKVERGRRGITTSRFSPVCCGLVGMGGGVGF